MRFDFDELIDRVGTHSSKWDTMEEKYGVSAADGIAMWVADMDFRPPPAVDVALKNALKHGVYGYFGDDGNYRSALVEWMERRHNWKVKPDWIVNTHGLGYAISLCVKSFSKRNEGIIVFSPVYHAFARNIKASGRRLVESPLIKRDGRYFMDLGGLEEKLRGDEKAILFCSPHNPGGRVWSKDEMLELAQFCEKHNLILICDEVHNDLVFKGKKHFVMARENSFNHRIVTLVATTKTFNLAGCMIGSIVASDQKLRDRILRVAKANGGMSFNRIGMLMCTAAWQDGEAWLDSLLVYLDNNRRIFDEGISCLPGVSSMRLDATYLCWVDFSGTGLTSQEIIRRVQEEAKIAANHGATFGTGGDNFLRFNVACRRELVLEAVQRLQIVFSDMQ